MGMTRSWRSTLAGTGAELVTLVGFTPATGYALVTWLPRAALQLTVGTLLLIFGLQGHPAQLRAQRSTTKTRSSVGEARRPRPPAVVPVWTGTRS
jgi:uncharacterized membrane protein